MKSEDERRMGCFGEFHLTRQVILGSLDDQAIFSLILICWLAEVKLQSWAKLTMNCNEFCHNV